MPSLARFDDELNQGQILAPEIEADVDTRALATVAGNVSQAAKVVGTKNATGPAVDLEPR